MTTAELRQVWPSVLEEVKRRRRFAHMLLSKHAQVLDVTDAQLLLGFGDAGARENFGSSGVNDLLIDAIIEVIGVELKIQAIMAGVNERPAEPRPEPPTPQPRAAEPQPAQPPQEQPEPQPRQETPPEYPTRTRRRPTPTPSPQPAEPEPEIADDDQQLMNADEMAATLLTQELGAQVIEDEPLA